MKHEYTPIHARAQIRGGPLAPSLAGEATFTQKRNGVLVTVRVIGLPRNNPSGFFALHIHEGTACTGEGFSDTGTHFNPTLMPHPRHAGDLPPLLDCGGEAYLSVMTDRFRVSDVVGRTVVIHSGADDFHTQPSGAAGEKIACGVIRRG